MFPPLGGGEVGESYFGGHRNGKRGRGAGGKVPVFGILQRGGRVYTQVIPHAKRKTLLPIMEKRILPDSIVYSDALPSHNALDTSAFRHFRSNHSKRFVKGQMHMRMGSKTFGIKPNAIYANTKAFLSIISICFSKNVQGASTRNRLRKC